MGAETRPGVTGRADEAVPDLAEFDDGGEAVCWAHLVCPECGAVISEGHLPGCGHDSEPKGRSAAQIDEPPREPKGRSAALD